MVTIHQAFMLQSVLSAAFVEIGDGIDEEERRLIVRVNQVMADLLQMLAQRFHDKKMFMGASLEPKERELYDMVMDLVATGNRVCEIGGRGW